MFRSSVSIKWTVPFGTSSAIKCFESSSSRRSAGSGRSRQRESRLWPDQRDAIGEMGVTPPSAVHFATQVDMHTWFAAFTERSNLFGFCVGPRDAVCGRETQHSSGPLQSTKEVGELGRTSEESERLTTAPPTAQRQASRSGPPASPAEPALLGRFFRIVPVSPAVAAYRCESGGQR